MVSPFETFSLTIDPPLKRFAQRFKYNGIDAIASRDLGFRVTPPAPPGQAQNTLIPKRGAPSETPPPHIPTASPLKREHEPPVSHRDRSPSRENGQPFKRQRPASPPPFRRPGGGYQERSPLPPQGLPPRRDERSSLPPVVPPREVDRSGLGFPLSRFIGSLPTTRAFDGMYPFACSM